MTSDQFLFGGNKTTNKQPSEVVKSFDIYRATKFQKVEIISGVVQPIMELIPGLRSGSYFGPFFKPTRLIGPTKGISVMEARSHRNGFKASLSMVISDWHSPWRQRPLETLRQRLQGW